jgi:glucosamine--fructose-6-phosphate aminotransferase (isomerizing)
MTNNFLKEILEQPQALEDTLNHYLYGDGQEVLGKVSSIWEKGNFDEIVFTGMGSSYFAPFTAACSLSQNGIVSMNINAGEFLHYHLPFLREKALLTCISQSGESYELVKVLEKYSGNRTIIGLTNEENSTLARKASVALLSKAGREDMTSSKTYVSTLLVLSVYTTLLSKKWKSGTMPDYDSAIEAVGKLLATRAEWLDQVLDFLGHPSFVQIIGRGPSYSSVLQGALMFMEAARNPAAGLYGGEFRHGPLEMTKPGFRAVLLAPVGPTYSQGIKLAEDITRLGGKVILITNSDAVYGNKDICPVRIPCQDEFLFPIPAIIPLQLIVNQWAIEQGKQPGDFLAGAKVTTIE